MQTDWSCEVALEKLADAIDDGSVKLRLDAATRTAVKDLYRDDFKALDEETWNAHETKVIEMANRAGGCAEMATILRWVDGLGNVGSYMDHETVLLVCVMVSKLHCSILRGALCPNVSYTEPVGKKLDEILKEIGALV